MEWQSSYVKKTQDKLTSCTVTILTLPLLPSPSFCQSLIRPPLSTLDTWIYQVNQCVGKSSADPLTILTYDFVFFVFDNKGLFVCSVQKNPLMSKESNRSLCLCRTLLFLIDSSTKVTDVQEKLHFLSEFFPTWPNHSLSAVMVVLTKTLLESKNSKTFITETALAKRVAAVCHY